MITVTPEQLRMLAGEVNIHTEIWDVRLASLTAHSSDPPFARQMTVTTEVETTARQLDDEHVEARARYHVRAFPMRDEGDDDEAASFGDEFAWEVQAELVASFNVSDRAPAVDLNDAHLGAFAVSTAAMTIHPFARELIQNTVGRMGYPPFTVELMRSPWYMDDDTEVQIQAKPEDLERALKRAGA